MDLKYLLHVSIPLWDHPQGAKNNVGLKLLRSTVYEVIWWHAVLFMLRPSGSARVPPPLYYCTSSGVARIFFRSD